MFLFCKSFFPIIKVKSNLHFSLLRPYWTHPIQSACSKCTTLQFMRQHIQHMAALPHAPTSPKKHAHAVAHRLWYQDVRGVSDSELVLTESRISLLQLRHPVSGGNALGDGWFPIAHTGHQHGDCDFVNDVHLSQNDLSECLVPALVSLPHHTTGNSEQSSFSWMIDRKIFLESLSKKLQTFVSSTILSSKMFFSKLQ